MGCGCGGGSATAEPAKTQIKYEFNGQQFDTRAQAETARQSTEGGGTIRTVAIKV